MVDAETARLTEEVLPARAVRARSIPVVGKSMWPLLRPDVWVDVRPLQAPPRLGAILVYVAPDRLVIHRLMRVLREAGQVRFVMKGDALPMEDPPIEPERVLGEVVVTRYRRFSLRVDNRIWRSLGRTLSRAAPVVHRARQWMRKVR